MFQRDIHRREGNLESEYPRPIPITLPFSMKNEAFDLQNYLTHQYQQRVNIKLRPKWLYNKEKYLEILSYFSSAVIHCKMVTETLTTVISGGRLHWVL